MLSMGIGKVRSRDTSRKERLVEWMEQVGTIGTLRLWLQWKRGWVIVLHFIKGEFIEAMELSKHVVAIRAQLLDYHLRLWKSIGNDSMIDVETRIFLARVLGRTNIFLSMWACKSSCFT